MVFQTLTGRRNEQQNTDGQHGGEKHSLEFGVCTFYILKSILKINVINPFYIRYICPR